MALALRPGPFAFTMDFILKGNILTSDKNRITRIYPQSYLVVEKGKIKRIAQELTDDEAKLNIVDYHDDLILPGFLDLHVHAPQYTYRGMAMDVELLDWLKLYAFPEESKYRDIEYAKSAYRIFVNGLKHSFSTRASIFGTLHKVADLELARQLQNSGLVTNVGLVNMNRNCPDYLRETSTKTALKDTEDFIVGCQNFTNVTPIITPRFTPTSSFDEMEALGKLREKYRLPVQSHLNENLNEIAYVKELEPWSRHYADTYRKAGLIGPHFSTIMAHCIYNSDEENKLLKENDVTIAHCPSCNMNVASGLAPIRKYLDMGIKVGLGSDVAGGHTLSLFENGKAAIQVSKMYYRHIDDTCKPLSAQDAFYLATLGGESVFPECGAFMEGYHADILVIDDSSIESMGSFNLMERLERLFYLAKEDMLVAKYVNGKKISLD